MSAKYQSTLYGIFLLVVGNVFFTISWVIIKVVSASTPLFEIIFFRSAVGAILIIATARAQRQPLKGNNKRLLYLRAFFGFISLIFVFTAIAHAHIGDVATLMNTSPFFVVLLAPLFLNEAFRRDILLWIFVAFAGVILIFKPSAEVVNIVALLALASGLLNGLSALCVRKLHETDNAITITFYFMWTTALASIPFMLKGFVVPGLVQLILLIIMGVTIALGQVLSTHSYKFAPASVIAPFNYSFVLLTYLAGLIFLGETPRLLSIIGAAVVVAAGVAIVMTQTSRRVLPAPRELHT